jgi:putative DNA methylase
MIPKECKRLAETDFPIAIVSLHSAREKSIRQGHPSTLQLWWARRPLGACRAMLLALLFPDPCDPACPDDFKQKARRILPRVQGELAPTDAGLRSALLRFIGDFANWKSSSNPVFVDVAKGLVRAASGDEGALVVDTFAGGGSIPLEALRIGCDSFASDLNPVACLILKTLLEDIPRIGVQFPEKLRDVGAEIVAFAEQHLSEFFPPDPDGSRPIAYLWAKTATCDNCGAEIPLISSFWLSKKRNRRRALRANVVRRTGETPSLEFEVFEPKNDDDVPTQTIDHAKAVCKCCNVVLPPNRLRAQIISQRGGSDTQFDGSGKRVGGARLIAVVTLSGSSGRKYRVAEERDYKFVWKAKKQLKHLATERIGTPLVPDEPVNPIRPSPNARGLSAVTRYGVQAFGDLFTSRQLLALSVLTDAVAAAGKDRERSSLLGALACAVAKRADYGSTGTRWHLTFEKTTCTFSKQALSMTWDFVEPTPLGDTSGSFGAALDTVESASKSVAKAVGQAGQTTLADAASSPLPDESANVWFTDPPYYDAIPYADLSDYFLVWLKRALPDNPLLTDPFDSTNQLSPKLRECVWNQSYAVDGKPKDGRFFEEAVARTFIEGRRVLREDGIGCVVFAHKTTEGWEALLTGIIRGGWVITGSWPIATERPGRLQSQDSAALATSVHLICRPRAHNALTGDWGEVLRELPKRVGDWIERLQNEGVRGADLVFACIGPAMEIYSRYGCVEDAEGREIPLGGDPTATEPYRRGFLAYVWETVGRLALEEVLGTAEARARNGAAGALEEDARLTALFLWTLQSTEAASSDEELPESDDDNAEEDDEQQEKPKKKKAGYKLIYDVARRFAQPLGIHLDKWEGRIIETEKGVVRLIPAVERASQLFGEADASAISRRIEADVKASRNYSFAFMQDIGAAPEIKTRGRGRRAGAQNGAAAVEAPAPQQVTTLDRLHAAMLLQRGGQTNGLRAMLREETQRGPDFLRLANALSRLYPKDSEEKRLLDAMLLAVPR